MRCCADGLYQPNPGDSRRPLIDLDLVVTFLPALLLGVSIGASLRTKDQLVLVNLFVSYVNLRSALHD